jgi:hypothetical protein
MLEARIRSRLRKLCLTIALLLAALAGFSSCATEKPQTALISDPDARAESSIPWNKPEKWETGAQIPGGIGGGGGPPGSSISN